MTTSVLRVMLVVDIAAMAILALVYLVHKRLPWQDFIPWALLALVVPILGPFFVIASRAGGRRFPIDMSKPLHPIFPFKIVRNEQAEPKATLRRRKKKKYLHF